MRDLLVACRTVKPQNIYINENLTPGRANILYTLRQAKKRFPGKLAACGSQDGRVYAWIKPKVATGKNTKVFINDKVKLETFCQDTFDVQVSQLLGTNVLA